MALTKKNNTRLAWAAGAIVLVAVGWKWRFRIPLLRRLFIPAPPQGPIELD